MRPHCNGFGDGTDDSPVGLLINHISFGRRNRVQSANGVYNIDTLLVVYREADVGRLDEVRPRGQRFTDKISTPFQRLPSIFGAQDLNGTITNTVRCNRKSVFQDSGRQIGIASFNFRLLVT
jgi:hypothetical protein